MRVLACSDFQLGAGADYGAQPGSRLLDQSVALGQIAEIAAAAEVDAVLFAGDAFQHRRPTVDELLVFRRWLGKLADLGIPAFGIPGNHDIRGPGRASSLSLFADRIAVFEQPQTVRLPGKAGLGFLPWAHPSTWRLAAPRIGRAADLPSYAEAIVEVAAGLKAELADDVPSFLVAHWAVSGFSLPSGLPVSALREPVLPIDDLVAQGWDCIIAGHIHRAQGGGPVIVPGSPAVCDFGEAELRHGCFVIDTGRGVLDVRFRPIEGRRFLTLAEAVEELALADVDEAVVRLKLVEREGVELDLGAIRKALYDQGAHKVWSIDVERERQARAGAEGLKDDEGPLELFDRWLESRDIPSGEAAQLRDKFKAYVEEG